MNEFVKAIYIADLKLNARMHKKRLNRFGYEEFILHGDDNLYFELCFAEEFSDNHNRFASFQMAGIYWSTRHMQPQYANTNVK